MITNFVLQALLAIVPVIFAITLHETAHGWAALALGDTTARDQGRLTLNPLRHIDRVGTIILPGLLLISQLLTIHRVAFMFGWAKPVPVSAWKFPNPRRYMAVVALAGPAMNFFLASVAGLALRGLANANPAEWLITILFDFILVNMVLGLFNLLPIPPLDGGRVLVGLLPEQLARSWSGLERYGLLIVLVVILVLPNVFGIDPIGDVLNKTVVPIALWLAGSMTETEPKPGPATSEALPPANDSLLLKLEGFEGPLDLLLELARAQKVDLAKISILALVDQYLAVIEGARKVRLELAAEWLVMAAWLTWLKSRLLVPANADDPEDPEQIAEMLTERLQALELIRAAAAWLGRRPVLGIDVFTLGAREDHTVIDNSRLVIDQAAFLASYLRGRRRGTKRVAYQPRKLSWFTVQDALQRMTSLLGSMPDWATLEQFLPEIRSSQPDSRLERRAAMSSTLIAGLELARGGQLRLRQEAAFGPILVGRGGDALEDEA